MKIETASQIFFSLQLSNFQLKTISNNRKTHSTNFLSFEIIQSSIAETQKNYSSLFTKALPLFHREENNNFPSLLIALSSNTHEMPDLSKSNELSKNPFFFGVALSFDAIKDYKCDFCVFARILRPFISKAWTPSRESHKDHNFYSSKAETCLMKRQNKRDGGENKEKS